MNDTELVEQGAAAGRRRPTRRALLAGAAALAAGWLAGCRDGAPAARPPSGPAGPGDTVPASAVPGSTVPASTGPGGTAPDGAGTQGGGAGRPPLVSPVAAPDDPGLAGDPFRVGVASGDPSADGFVLWTRLVVEPTAEDSGLGALAAADFELACDVALDEACTEVVRSWLVAAPAGDGHSVHAVVEGLAPDGEWYYRFRLGPWTSRTGRTRTSPAPGAEVARVVVAAAACQHWETGWYAAHRDLAAARVDAVLFLGDFIYEGAAVDGRPRRHPEAAATDLAGYRLRYAWYRSDPDLQAAQASAPWIAVWDDHEVENNYAAAYPAAAVAALDPGAASPDTTSADATSGDTTSGELDDLMAAFEVRRAAAYRAWWENQPVRLPRPEGSELAAYREVGWGDLARFVMLDGRSARSPQACGSAGFGNACPALGDAARTMLGPEQEGWLTDAFERSAIDGVAWTVLGNQTVLSELTVPIGREPITLFDQWDGYPAARRRLLEAATAAGVQDLLVLTGDLHCTIAADIELDGRGTAAEVVVSSISSPFPEDRSALFRLGVGLLRHVHAVDTDRRGYALATITATESLIELRHVVDATDPASAVETGSRWRVRRGRPQLEPA